MLKYSILFGILKKKSYICNELKNKPRKQKNTIWQILF